MATSQSNNATSSLSTKDNPTTLSTVVVVSPSQQTQTEQSSSTNIASLLNPSTLSTLSSIRDPKTFGDQAKDLAKQQITKAITESTLAKLLRIKAELVKEGITLDIKHQLTLQQIEIDHTPKKQVQNGQTIEIPPKLNDEEYQLAVNAENKNYNEAKKNLQDRKIKNQKDLDDYYKDPFKKQKDAIKARKEKRAKRKARTRAEKIKSIKDKRKAILQNAKKSLVPIITLLLTNKIAEIIAQNDKVGKLVNDTNALITDANESGDPIKLNNAKLARDNAIKIIQSNEEKIIKIQNDINRISTYISIFNIIVNIISAIPIPTAVPPGIGIPTSLIIRFVKILDKANRILLSLSALIPILLSILDKAIAILKDYKSQLLNINGELDKAAASGIGGTSSLLSIGGAGGTGIGLGTVPGDYKGFRFAIKEDKSFGGISVGGFKRHYAVAIDVYDVEVLKSELSFTLDPNDLIEQLKLVIDQNNLSPSSPSSTGRSPSNPITQNQTNNPPDSMLKVSKPALPSVSILSAALQESVTLPPQPEVITGPTRSLPSVKIPLSLQKKAFYVGIIAAPVPPTPPNFKIDAAYILKKNAEWDARYKTYLRNANTNIVKLPS
jgi:hypothetical protein